MWLVVALLVGGAAPIRADHGGWSYLIDKLAADGVHRTTAVEVFTDPRLPRFDGLEFSPARPRESHARYRRFLQAGTVADARRCRAAHAAAFERAERTHGVSADVIAAILFVETACGRNTGTHQIFYRLARLAMANAPATLQRNIEHFPGDADAAMALRERARYLEATFYPEVRSLFELAERTGIDPLGIRGSPSGAFGFPQFLPSSYVRFGTDGDGDGRVSLYDMDDAAASCARYFAAHGWRPGLSATERRQVVWAYNHSDAYVDTVLTLAARLGNADDSRPRVAKRRPPAKRTAKRTTVASAHTKTPR
jgi:membrane-bound lytic murein transglycosylase B